VSHEKTRRGSLPWRRRFDFVFITPDMDPIAVRYYPIARAREVGSSHAPVVADLAFRRFSEKISGPD
jgi:endonuclease/exonuclease/phosphatase family metal-dependent hydrolase